METTKLLAIINFLSITGLFYSLGILLSRWLKIGVHPLALSVPMLYLFFIVTLSVNAAWVALMIFGLLAFVVQFKKMKVKSWGFFFLIGLVLFLVICQHPLMGWDTRSIWFFHAKIMHYFSGAEMMQNFGREEIASFSHSDYPKLHPFLSALFAHPFSEWKEQVAKSALALLWIPIFTEVFNLKNIKIKGITLFCILVLSGGQIIAGMTDWLLACYALIAFLIFHENEERWLDSIVYLSLPLLIKAEGLVISGLGIGILWIAKSGFSIPSLLKNLRKLLPLMVVPALGFLGWKFWCARYEIHNYMTQDSGAAITRLMARIGDGGKSFWIFGDAFGYYNKIIKNMFYVALVARLILWKKITLTEVAAFAFTACYFVFLFLVYMATPFDLDWHLSTSVERTAFPIFLLTVVILVIRDIDPAKKS